MDTHHDDFYTHKLKVRLARRDPISCDSYMFRFEFDNPGTQLGMHVTQHILIYGENMKGEIVSRKYTAISDQPGFFEIPIKIYRPCPAFPDGGELTPWLEKIELNTQLTIKRCIGKLLYKNQEFILRPKTNTIPQKFNKLFICCGGSGITPAYQVIMSIVKNKDPIEIFLVYSNRTEDNIWLRDALQKSGIHLHLALDNPPANWTGSTGFVNKELFDNFYGKPDEHTLALLCGPKPMNKVVISLFEQMGLEKDKQIVKF